MIKAVGMFILGLLLLIVGGDLFVGGASDIARKFHLPDLLIGATVVSIGTTLPEVMVSASGALQGHSEIAYGNALGSIICNTALISAITIAVAPSAIKRKTMVVPSIFFFIAAALYSFAAYGDGYFSRLEGIVLLLIFVIYIGLQIREALKDNSESSKESDTKEKPFLLDLFYLVLGAVMIAYGADLLVDNGTLIARAMHVAESVIALTFVALGTSLPELVTAIISLKKGHGLLSLGNIIGANLFNLVLVCGISITLCPFAVPSAKLIHGLNASLVLDIPVMWGVMLLLVLPPLLKEKLYRWQGILLLLIYSVYSILQFCL